ncbi:PTS galactitol transporter subunit IIC [Streptococcus mutans]|jgi:Phosphotransferase system, galactitol-specific IIC component|uniref:PTS galactitol transporter subunit IIC n=1 Tax=Streptococcus mutans TaxID=1309 RepID=UPI0002B56F9D|nr:PTS transporter subunit IIC [Streptococcus mutans]RKV70827.1 MAG: PTS glucitol transporter subunit IIA [Streptococcus sp.]AVM71159.1 PTS glucitol transporter subunit IIA [Streptococcus mutans]EMB61949.1 Putative PTS system, mannitol/fructose-specific, IIC component [Streptococcus mutans 1SM1]EMB70434.1 Putative PTS system, mannitol/fructose-specific, IIC component [Streptococcus mutans 11SSST2]EMC28182.1 Putative PTS system, mannitol/fructose-specific, IIC component [Streptococcus mutans ST
MNVIIEFANAVFKPIIDLGAAPLMTVILTIIALCFRVKFTKALEGGIKLGIALTGISAIINILSTAFSGAMTDFVDRTGLHLNITDVGWAPLATITWGSPYTLYFLLVMLIVNIIMLVFHQTNTLDVDIFDIWHLSIVGLFAIFSGANLLVATVLVIFIGVLKIINSDVMKPTFNDLLGTGNDNPMTTTHMNYMMNPIIMVFDKIFDKLFPWLDKYDFDAAKLNAKIGFWGSKFAIGVYLGIFVGLLAGQTPTQVISLAFTAAVCLELFSLIGSWFIAAVEPLSQGITNFASSKLKGRTLNIGLDWPFLAGRAEIWAAANILAPIMLFEAIILPGNKLLPLAGIIAMGVTPALLVVTRGKLIRMIIIGTIELPLFLWSGSLMAPFITETAKKVGAFPKGISSSTLISHTTMEGPIEKFLAYFAGKGTAGDVQYMLYAVIALAVYTLLFFWYVAQMKKRNQAYEEAK